MRAALAVTLAGLFAIGLAGCGKKAEPSPPGPASAVIYPKSYPPAP